MDITNCTFNGVKWDDKALESVNLVAKALLNMTQLFKSQNIEIECLLKLEQVTKKDLGPELEPEPESELDVAAEVTE